MFPSPSEMMKGLLNHVATNCELIDAMDRVLTYTRQDDPMFDIIQREKAKVRSANAEMLNDFVKMVDDSDCECPNCSDESAFGEETIAVEVEKGTREHMLMEKLENLAKELELLIEDNQQNTPIWEDKLAEFKAHKEIVFDEVISKHI
jgi:hypothetical protein